MELLFDMRERVRSTLVLITHDPALAARCGRIVHMADGRLVVERRIVAIGGRRFAFPPYSIPSRPPRIARRRRGAAHRAGVPGARRRRHRRGRDAARRDRGGAGADGSRILGGDLEVQWRRAAAAGRAARPGCAARGARISDVVTMRSMLVAPSGERMLVELKAVDGAWPLIGQATLPGDGVDAEPIVLERLGVHAGRHGAAGQRIRRAARADRRGAGPGRHALDLRAARADRAGQACRRPGWSQPGSIVEYHLRALLPPGAEAAQTIGDLRAAFPNQGWRIRDCAQRRAGRRPVHRPHQPVHDAGGADRAAGRRHRRRQWRARVAGGAGEDDRHAALPGRLRPGWCSRWRCSR